MPYGPRKIVLINAGRYDYAEIELGGAIQLVGPNNTGKTTLINTLQFLYLDDRRHMDFGSYSEDQTRSYYFPNQFSYVLFEVLGAQGLHVIGWRGQSRISGGEPERFVVSGRFDQSDFLDESYQVREPKAVNARLALKDYAPLRTAQEYREALLLSTRGEAKGFGVVALRDNDRYSQFRDTLKNLLSLNTISQDQMRDQLLMMADLQKSGYALDVRQLFGDDYDRILRLKEKLVRFKRSQRDVELVVETFNKLEAIRDELCSRWRDLQAKRKEFEADRRSRIERVASEAGQTTTQIEKVLTAVQNHRSRCVQLAEKRGGVQTKLNMIVEQGKDFEGFLESFARTALKNTQDEIRVLQRQLEESEDGDRCRAEHNISKHTELVNRTQRAIENFDHALCSFLRQRFSDEELSDLIRLFNFDILEQPLGPQNVSLRNPDVFISNLKHVTQRIRRGVYRDETADIHLPRPQRDLSEIENIKALQEQLREYEAELRKWKHILDVIKSREAIAARLQSLREEVEGKRDEHGNEVAEGLRKQLFRFEAFQKAHVEEPALKAQLTNINESISGEEMQIETLSSQEQELRGKAAGLAEEERQLRVELATQVKNLNDCEPPEPSLECEPAPFTAAGTFADTIDRYRERQKLLASLQNQFQQLLFSVEKNLGSDFTGVDERDTVRLLREELEALADRESVLSRDWELQITNVRATFSEILKSLDDVKSAADRLNRELSRIRVSNLTALRMEVMEAVDVVGSMRRLVNAEQPGLFDETTSVEGSIAAFRQKFEANPLLRYADLFTLRFTVTGDDGKLHHYHDFRQVESHGTTITIKVLFNLLVLRSLLREDSQKGLLCELPFFLDEVHSLDSINRRAILDTARTLGFLAITAAPDSVGEVDALYFLQAQQGRITLRRKHCVHVRVNQQSV
jgi:energy-coupling factor transporter ATP-binding protein EcfA2